jgi:2-desacetyl-2-hydroxyethyl bacteriochlorophyllide A dehydrogenase
MTETARAFWIVGRERAEIREEVLCDPAPGEVLVRAVHSGVSRGTELVVYRGKVPRSEHGRMRAPHQAGEFPWPVKYGYASVGEVVAGAPDWVGRSVFCLHPHQSAYVVPVEALVPLPDGVPADRAVLAANMETALNCVWDAELARGARVGVVGAGTVGALVAYLAGREVGADVELVDIDARKAEVARSLGVAFADPARARGEADVVVHASGTAEGLATALGLARFEGTVVEASWYGDAMVPVPLGAAFHARRLTLRSSQVGEVAPSRRADHTRRQRLERALALLRDPALDALVTGACDLEELPGAFAALARGDRFALTLRIDYRRARS